MSHSKLRAIGRLLKEEESRFIGYSEIERKSKELGFGMTVRTLRFYVDEGILPSPKKVGKTPVYEEEWILNVLLAIHLMKTRLNRSLTEIRTILGRLQEDPATLADKLTVLYDEYVRGERLEPMERASLVDGFFDLLTGRLGEVRQASEVRLAELVDAVTTSGTWDGDTWVPPTPDAILVSQGAVATPEPEVVVRLREAAPAVEAPAALDPAAAEAPVEAAPVEAAPVEPAPVEPAPVDPAPLPTTLEAPLGAVTAEQARAVEEVFIQRFEVNFDLVGRVHCPLDNKAYKAGPRERTLLKRDQSSKVIDLMKRNRVYDRSLLDAIPLGEMREYQVHQRGLFGRGDLKVVVAGLALSPLEEFVRRRWTAAPLGPLEAERAIDGFPLRDDVFYYVGLLSTAGWSAEARSAPPSRRNLLTCLVEDRPGTAWTAAFQLDPRWAGMERLFDPETEREKTDRAREHIAECLRPKGEFLIIRNLPEDLDVDLECVAAAIDELLAEDPQLMVVESGGREIIKRRRL